MTRQHRREFLKQSVILGAAAASRQAWAAEPARPAASGDKLNIAVIGVAHRGNANLVGVAGENIVALCDCDAKLLADAGKRFPKAQTFADFRVMMDKVAKSVDAVVVSTADHTHAVCASLALSLGKHVYCEKPLTHDVFESRYLTDLARRKKVATQLGTQIHAGANYRRVVELVQAGAIGPVAEVHVWAGASYGGMERPTDTPPVPAELNWDLWIGPAPYRPYNPAYVPGKWRNWWDFGTGSLGDFGCHYMDLPFWALGLKYPTSVEPIDGPPVHPESTPKWLVMRYQYPARGQQPPVTLTWYDGGKRPKQLADYHIEAPAAANAKDKKAKRPAGQQPADWGSGVLFIGAKGVLLADYTRHYLLPEQSFRDFQRPAPTIPDSVGHHQEWINACKSGSPTTCNFDYSGPLSEAALLGTVAYRTQSKLAWDAANLKATNCAEAERYIRRDYRQGWKLY